NTFSPHQPRRGELKGAGRAAGKERVGPKTGAYLRTSPRHPLTNLVAASCKALGAPQARRGWAPKPERTYVREDFGGTRDAACGVPSAFQPPRSAGGRSRTDTASLQGAFETPESTISPPRQGFSPLGYGPRR